MRADSLEQVFIRRESGVHTLLLVFESRSGRRERVTLTAPRGDESAAIDFLARYLAQTGARLAAKPRVRVETGSGMTDAPHLLARLGAAVATDARRVGREDSTEGAA